MFKLVEITKKDYQELDYQVGIYFSNGCIFDDSTNNLIAFPWYSSPYEEPSKWFKVVED